MNRLYECTFNGRKAGAIGIFYNIYERVQAESKEQAEKKLYEQYEHITRLTITEVMPND